APGGLAAGAPKRDPAARIRALGPARHRSIGRSSAGGMPRLPAVIGIRFSLEPPRGNCPVCPFFPCPLLSVLWSHHRGAGRGRRSSAFRAVPAAALGAGSVRELSLVDRLGH